MADVIELGEEHVLLTNRGNVDVIIGECKSGKELFRIKPGKSRSVPKRYFIRGDKKPCNVEYYCDD